mmetsp:Transcript_15451/g.65178  ORF Transcript_15451/g.65178 Transcript_15451/m.65178 type:complete len:234 (+) Transcript_15451:262-963(+)
MGTERDARALASRARAPSPTTRRPNAACSSRRHPASSCPTRGASFRWWARWFWRATRTPCTPCSRTTSRRRAYSPRWTPCAWTRWTTGGCSCSRAAGGGSWCSAARSRASWPCQKRNNGDTWRWRCTKKDSYASSRGAGPSPRSLRSEACACATRSRCARRSRRRTRTRSSSSRSGRFCRMSRTKSRRGTVAGTSSPTTQPSRRSPTARSLPRDNACLVNACLSLLFYNVSRL